MINDSSGQPTPSSRNRGVNFTSDALPVDNTLELNNSDFPSLYEVRNQLHNVIDVMGTTTPHLIYSNIGEEADNEESVISSTSVYSSVLKVKNVNRNVDCQSSSTFNSPRDISETSYTYTGCKNNNCPIISEVQQDKSKQTICVPAILPPAVLCMNPNCVCGHSAGYMQQIPISLSNPNHNEIAYQPKEKSKNKYKLSYLIEKFTRKDVKKNTPASPELYNMNIMETNANTSPPKRFVFDLVEEASKPELNTIGTNTKKPNNITNTCLCVNDQIKKLHAKRCNCAHKGISSHSSRYAGVTLTHNHADDVSSKAQHATYYKEIEEQSRLQYRCDRNTAKVDVYYFDHGNAAYYKTTDSPPIILSEVLAEKAERYATKFWAELFGTIYIGCAFITSFILQFFRFILYSILRPLTIGLLQLVSDYFFKPFLATLFNAVIQPPLIFLYNVATSLRDLCDPIAEGLGYFIREIAVLCKSIRLFEIRSDKCTAANKTQQT